MMWHIFSAFDFRFPYLGGVKFSYNAVGGQTNYLTPYPGSTVWAPLGKAFQDLVVLDEYSPVIRKTSTLLFVPFLCFSYFFLQNIH